MPIPLIVFTKLLLSVILGVGWYGLIVSVDNNMHCDRPAVSVGLMISAVTMTYLASDQFLEAVNLMFPRKKT